MLLFWDTVENFNIWKLLCLYNILLYAHNPKKGIVLILTGAETKQG